MIPGVVSSAGIVPSFGPPSSSLVYLDFVAGNYWLGATATALGDLFNRTDFVVAGSGALFDWNTADLPALMSSTLMTAINSAGGAFTVVCEWKRLETGYSDLPIVLHSATNEFYFDFYQDYSVTPSKIGASAKYTYAWRYLETTPAPGIGNIARAVLRYDKDTGFALAVNGAFVNSISDSASSTPTFTSGALGGDPDSDYVFTNSYIRKIEFYPLKTNSEMTTLSAL